MILLSDYAGQTVQFREHCFIRVPRMCQTVTLFMEKVS
jgi:hypothetical protein